jgi:biopolymer transport protein ExbD
MMTRHRIRPCPLPAEAPIGSLNTTPLIDVMLVLLIMFIVTIPITTHKVPLDLPSGPSPATEMVVHQLEIDERGSVRLDGSPVAESELGARLQKIDADPAHVLHLRTAAETRYEDFNRVIAMVKAAGITRLGMIDNARFAQAG